MSIFRAYFFDEKGNELTTHPLNGKYWTATGGALRDPRNGKFNKRFHDSVTVADYASLRCVKNDKKVTIADFPGHRKVGVKVWYGPDSQDKFWLVPVGFCGLY